jgi:hypothetical protein
VISRVNVELKTISEISYDMADVMNTLYINRDQILRTFDYALGLGKVLSWLLQLLPMRGDDPFFIFGFCVLLHP